MIDVMIMIMKYVIKTVMYVIKTVIYVCGTVIIVASMFFVVNISVVINGYSEKYRCVHLKNGLNIGYKAVFDLSRPYWKSYGVPKFPDGTPLVDQRLWSVYVTDTSIYGRTLGKPGAEAFDFFWRADTGLVRKEQDWERYKKLVSQAGSANVGIGTSGYGPLIVMWKLMKRPEYADQWCSTKLITW